MWKPSTTFANLTTEEIQASATRAQEVNRLLTVQQTCDDETAANVTTEQLAPEIQINQLPQVGLDELAEWLQDESIKKEF